MFKTENYLVTIIMIAMIFLAGYFGSRYIGVLALGTWTKGLSAQAEELKNEYAEEIKTETDINKLLESGARQINVNQADYAIITLEHAAQIEPKARDAWVLMGAAYLKTNDFSKALEVLKKAEEIDPTYAKTYEYLEMTYHELGNTTEAQKAKEKKEYLGKSSN
jgi:tetratricopeptide (TPR) repeat protein